MRPGETLLQMVHRHVDEGERHVREQTELVARLAAAQSGCLDEARAVLAMFQSTQAAHERHRDQIEDEIRTGIRDAAGQLLPLS